MNRLAATAAALLLFSLTGHAWTYNGSRWFIPQVDMHLRMPGPGGTLLDGSTSWEQTVSTALGLWNPYMSTMQFRSIRNSTAATGLNNGINNVVFGTSAFGMPFGANVLALTLKQTVRDGTVRAVEADVVFNSSISWNSYRGAPPRWNRRHPAGRRTRVRACPWTRPP